MLWHVMKLITRQSTVFVILPKYYCGSVVWILFRSDTLLVS